MTLVCPLCSEILEEEGVHFFKHFKYKKFACGEATCDAEFYTEADRNAHCTKHSHKRSFQKTVNPYIDRLIEMVSSDARELTTKDMETVLENRFGTGDDDCVAIASSTPSRTPSSQKKKRTLNSLVAPVAASKKPRASAPEEHSAPPSAPKQRRSTKESASEPVDSTTSEPALPVEKPRKSRKKNNTEQSEQGGNTTYEEMSGLDKLIEWFDPNAPERQDAAKVACAVCKKEVVYDYILRRNHVTGEHMAADTDPNDYNDLLKVAMDLSWPDLPNSNFSCQLCMTGLDIRRCARREHIERMHTNSLPPLKCPVDDCGTAFRRQCELSSHMKKSHSVEMSKLKDSEFQLARKRRNRCISTMTVKCFPWCQIEEIEGVLGPVNGHTLTASSSAPLLDANFRKDVRVRDVNKTRRAPQYNQNGGSSSDSSDSEAEEDDEAETSTSTAADAEDIVVIKEMFNVEVNSRLQGLRTIKMEPETEEEKEAVDPQQQPQQSQRPFFRDTSVKLEDLEANSTNPELAAEYGSPIALIDARLPPPQLVIPEPILSPIPVHMIPTPPMERTPHSPKPSSSSSYSSSNYHHSHRGGRRGSRDRYHGGQTHYHSSNSRTNTHSRPYHQSPRQPSSSSSSSHRSRHSRWN